MDVLPAFFAIKTDITSAIVMPAVNVFRNFIGIFIFTIEICTPLATVSTVFTLDVAGQASFTADFCVFFNIIHLKTRCDALRCSPEHLYGVFSGIFDNRTVDSCIHTLGRKVRFLRCQSNAHLDIQCSLHISTHAVDILIVVFKKRFEYVSGNVVIHLLPRKITGLGSALDGLSQELTQTTSIHRSVFHRCGAVFNFLLDALQCKVFLASGIKRLLYFVMQLNADIYVSHRLTAL